MKKVIVTIAVFAMLVACESKHEKMEKAGFCCG